MDYLSLNSSDFDQQSTLRVMPQSFQAKHYLSLFTPNFSLSLSPIAAHFPLLVFTFNHGYKNCEILTTGIIE